MPFDNPYFPTTFDIGTPGAGHMHFDPAGSVWYAPDGVTANLTYDSATGNITLIGTITLAPGATIPGAAITGTVANATNAVNATTVPAGGVTGQIGTTQIAAGSITTPLLSATAIDGMTITGALIRTAAAGLRIEITGTNRDTITLFTGIAAEASAPQIWSASGGAAGAETVGVFLASGDTTNGTLRDWSRIDLVSATANGASSPFIAFRIGGNGRFGVPPIIASITGTVVTINNTTLRLNQISSGGDILTVNDQNGHVFFNITTATDFNISNTQYSAQFFGDTNATSFSTGLFLASAATGNRPLVIRGVLGQLNPLFQVQSSTTATIAQITNTGNVQGTGAYTTLSDARVKSNVKPVAGSAINVIRRLRPVHFDYTDGEIGQTGFIAQEVGKHIPTAITRWDDDLLGSKSEVILAYTVKALQELIAETGGRRRRWRTSMR